MSYKVINSKTGEDLTYDFDWVIRPSGELFYLDYCDLISHPDAKAVFVGFASDIP